MDKIVLLDVPYHEKDEAKRLGARWNPDERRWYVPEGKSPEAFSKWLPETGADNELQISTPIYAVESLSSCWSCGSETPVVALAVDHIEGQDQDEEEEKCLRLLSEIEELPLQLLGLLSPRYSFLKKRYSKTANRRYYMNHCSCGAPLGDFFLHSEPWGAFFPTSPEEAEQIFLRELPVSGSFKVKASFGQVYPDLIGTHAQRESYGGSA